MNRLSTLPHLLLLVLTGWLSGGCTSIMYTRLEPVSGEVARLDGRAVTRVSTPDSVVVVASFEREDLDYNAFDLEVKNRSSHALEVDPARFRMLPLDANQAALVKSSQTSVTPVGERKAADPSRELRQMNGKREQEVKRLKRARIINTVLMVALVVSDVASSGRNQSYESWRNNRIGHEAGYGLLQAKRVIDHGSFADRMQRYDYEAYRWRELALKRTIVPPGESVRGFVYIPKKQRAAFLRLSYPTSDTASAVVLFQQQRVKTRPADRR